MPDRRAVRRVGLPALVGLVGLVLTAAPALAGPAAAVPGAPRAVKAVAGNATITVSWSPPSSTGGSAITSYTASCTGGGATPTKTVAGTLRSAVIVAKNGTAYTCKVVAKNAVGAGPASAPTPKVTPAGPPTAPRNVVASTKGTTLTVTWAAPSSTGGSALTGYSVSCTSTDGGATLTGSAAGSAKSAAISAVPADKTYLCVVTAKNAKGNSPAGTAADYVQHVSLGGAVASTAVHAPVHAGQRASLKVLRTTFSADGCFVASLNAPAGTDPTTGSFCQDPAPEYLVASYTYTATGTATATLVPRSNSGTADVAFYIFTDIKMSTTVTAPAKTITATAPGQVALLTFMGKAGEQIVVTGSKATIPGVFSVRDPSNDEVGFGRFYVNDTVADGPFTLATAATYTLQVIPDGYATGTVTVLLRDNK